MSRLTSVPTGGGWSRGEREVRAECESGVEGKFVASGAGGDAHDGGAEPAVAGSRTWVAVAQMARVAERRPGGAVSPVWRPAASTLPSSSMSTSMTFS